MTRKQMLQEVFICDECGANLGTYANYTCLRCGKDYCYDCGHKLGVKYSHAVNFGGSNDGFYCTECDKAETSPLHAAYVAVRDEREYNAAVYARIAQRTKVADERVQQELRKLGK